MNENPQLSESVVKELLEAAKASGKTPSEWIRSHLPEGKAANGEVSRPTEEELAAADLRLDSLVVHLGYPTGIENDEIDSDLAREYADTHEPTKSELGN